MFCDAAAASVIRGYTTELVIHPVLDQEYGMEEVTNAYKILLIILIDAARFCLNPKVVCINDQ